MFNGLFTAAVGICPDGRWIAARAGICVAMTALRPLLGVSASLHDFGDYGGVGIQRPLLQAGGLPLMLPQLPEA
jgi:hypothetical protein